MKSMKPEYLTITDTFSHYEINESLKKADKVPKLSNVASEASAPQLLAILNKKKVFWRRKVASPETLLEFFYS